MKVYIVEEYDWDSYVNHGVFLDQQLAESLANIIKKREWIGVVYVEEYEVKENADDFPSE